MYNLTKFDKSAVNDNYCSVAIFFHWAIALLIFANLLTGTLLANDIVSLNSSMQMHKQTGILILILVICRIIWRLTHHYPTLNEQIPVSEKLLDNFGHLFLYFLILAMPLSGVLMVQSAGKQLNLLGVMVLPKIVNQNSELFEQFLDIHKSLAIMLVTMIVGHTIAALKHHFIDKNQVLLRMLPKVLRRDKLN